MFDNVTLKVYGLPKNYILSKKVEGVFRSDENTFSGRIRNMGIYKNLNGLRIYGSLAKYLQGENITPLSRDGFRQGIEELEQDIGLSLKTAILTSVEFGTSITLSEKPFEYLNLFGHTKRLTRVEYSKWAGVETVSYVSKTGSFEFTGYDKIKEMLDRGQEIPPLFANSNVLRLEYRIRQRRGIIAKFNGDLLACELFGERIYQKFQKLFYDDYKSIEKMGQLVYVDTSKNITPSLIQRLFAEQYRQSNHKDCQHFLQQLDAAGKLSPKSRERLRAENKRLGNDIAVSDKSPLIKELDGFVYERMRFGA